MVYSDTQCYQKGLLTMPAKKIISDDVPETDVIVRPKNLSDDDFSDWLDSEIDRINREVYNI